MKAAKVTKGTAPDSRRTPGHLPALLYLAGQSLPVGAFAWSQGLEGACAEALVHDAPSLRVWLHGILRYGLERLDLPLLLRSYRAAAQKDRNAFLAWDALLKAGRESAELLLEEEQMGLALGRILHAQKLWPDWLGDCSCGYVAAFALAAERLGCLPEAEEDVACAYAISWLQNQVVTACKCLPLGQSAAQEIVIGLMAFVPDYVQGATRLADEEIGACLPALAIASSRHEEQYSRMFRS